VCDSEHSGTQLDVESCTRRLFCRARIIVSSDKRTRNVTGV